MNDPIDYPALEPSYAHLISGIAKLFARVFRSRIERENITDGEWRCLRSLWDHDGISQRELADLLDMTTAAAVFWVNALERDGFAKRCADGSDARKYLVRLTAKGKRVRDRLRPEIAAVHRRVFHDFSVEEFAVFRSLLERVQANLVDMYADERGERLRV